LRDGTWKLVQAQHSFSLLYAIWYEQKMSTITLQYGQCGNSTLLKKVEELGLRRFLFQLWPIGLIGLLEQPERTCHSLWTDVVQRGTVIVLNMQATGTV